METVTIGLDVGTTSCKAVALDPDGRVRGTAAATYPLLTGAGGRAEQNPETLYKAVCRALTELGESLHDTEVAGLAVSGAMHSVLPLGAELEPLHNALTWADSRAGEHLLELKERADEAALYNRTGCPLQTPYHPARLSWLRAADAELFRHTAWFVALKDFIVYRLCGTLATDIGLASTTGLLDIHSLHWHDAALELAGVTAAQLPALGRPTEQAGVLSKTAAAATGLRVGLPVFLGSSDGGLANLGSGVVRPGETILTLGTSGAVRQVAEVPQLGEQRLTWCYLLDEGHYFAGGAINNGGLALEWLRRTFYSELPRQQGFAQLLRDSAEVQSSDLICLPYLTGERTPHWDTDLRGAFFGVAEHHRRADLVRAGLEGVAFCLADVLELMRSNALPVQLTGGAARAPFLAQLITDTLGVETELNRVADASALGTAMLAQVALAWTTLQHAAERAAGSARHPLQPDPQQHARLEDKRRRAQRLLGAIKPLDP